MHEIRTVIFDVGGVLLQYRWKYVLIDYGLSEEEAERVGHLMLNDPLWNELDLGVTQIQRRRKSYGLVSAPRRIYAGRAAGDLGPCP